MCHAWLVRCEIAVERLMEVRWCCYGDMGVVGPEIWGWGGSRQAGQWFAVVCGCCKALDREMFGKNVK
jgi:hypothetical protein